MAPGRGRRTRRCRRYRARGLELVPAGRSPRLSAGGRRGVPRCTRGAPPRDRGSPAWHAGADAGVRMPRTARMGHAVPNRGAPSRPSAAPGIARNRRGRRVPRAAVHPLRRLPLLHPGGRAPKPRSPRSRRPERDRAAGLPARGDGPVQVGGEGGAPHPRRTAAGLLRPGAGDPRPRHGRVSVRSDRLGLRGGRDRDAGGPGGVHPAPTRIHRARTAAAITAARRPERGGSADGFARRARRHTPARRSETQSRLRHPRRGLGQPVAGEHARLDRGHDAVDHLRGGRGGG